MMRATALLTLCVVALPVHAQLDRETAVVALTDGAGEGPALASAVRKALVALNARVLSVEDTEARMLGPRNAGRTLAVDVLEDGITRADKALSDDKNPEAITILEQLLVRAEADPDLTAEKAERVRAARVKLASALLITAGRAESGQANTEPGRKAQEQLRRVLQQDPAFSLDPARYPPRLRSLLERARTDLGNAPRGKLTVQSRPLGATVLVDGRALGLTPFSMDSLAQGPHRVWLEWQGKRSIRRTVNISPAPAALTVDMLVEGAWIPALAGLRADPVDLEDGLLAETAALLGVRLLVVVLQRGDMAGVLVFDADKSMVVRRGSAAAALPELGTVLARFSALGLVGREVEPLKPLADAVVVPKRVAVLGDNAVVVDALSSALLSRGAEQLVDASALQERCGAANACLLEGAAVLKLDAVVQLGQAEGRWDAGLMDVHTGREVRRASLRASGMAQKDAQALAVKLLDPLWFAGGVEVQAPRDGLKVLLDGAELGTTPITQGRTGIMVGRHVVRVSGTALEDAETTVDVPYGAPVEVVVGINGRKLGLTVKGQRAMVTAAAAQARSPVRGHSAVTTSAAKTRARWPWAITAAGGAGAVVLVLGALAGGAMVALGAGLAATFERTGTGALVVRDGESVQQAQLRAYGSAGLLGGGGVLAVLGVLGTVLAVAAAASGVVLWLVL